MIRACKNCRFGVLEKILLGEDKPMKPVIVCKLIPPIPQVDGVNIHHRRPMLELTEWCGQFRLSLRKLLSRSDG